jgi:hypothetical protein
VGDLRAATSLINVASVLFAYKDEGLGIKGSFVAFYLLDHRFHLTSLSWLYYSMEMVRHNQKSHQHESISYSGSQRGFSINRSAYLRFREIGSLFFVFEVTNICGGLVSAQK